MQSLIPHVVVFLLTELSWSKEHVSILKSIDTGKVPTRSVLEGYMFYTVCKSPGYTSDEVYWENEVRSFYSLGKELSIMNISRSMSGLYICHGQNDTETLVLEYIIIDVQYPAKILFWNDSGNALYPNESFVSFASVEGNPPPEVVLIFSKRNREIIFKEGEGQINLTIARLQCDHTGLYELHCTNSYNSETMNKNISVFCPPYINPDAKMTFKVRPRLGESERLMMSAAGYPVPVFTWKHDAREIQHEDNNYISTVDITVENVDGFGEYQLEMRNTIGSANFTFCVIPSGPPERPENLSLVTYNDNSATLSWIPGYDYNNTQSFVVLRIDGDNMTELQTFADNPTDNEQNFTGTLYNLKPDSPYNLTMKAVNTEGSTESNMFVHFVTKDRVTSLYKIIIIASATFGGVVLLVVLFAFTTKAYRSRQRQKNGYENIDDKCETKCETSFADDIIKYDSVPGRDKFGQQIPQD